MQGVALRAHDNPALNFAVERANDLAMPVLVYHGLRHDYPWASDRLHTFILESAIDLRQEFADRGIQYAFYLDRDRKNRPGESPLRQLASRACLIVTDFFPTFIMPRQTRALRSKVEAPVIAVDSATVVPMAHFTGQHATARAMRPRLHEMLPHYLHPVGDTEPSRTGRFEVPFDDPVAGIDGRRARAQIAGLVESCDIDHAVAPARNIRGGARAARERLGRFLAHGLRRYDPDRNDPTLDATSGMSPYLHFGNISIQEVLLSAREAGSPHQYAKFEDQALVWRELAHNFVFHDRKHRTPSAVPAWARRELDDHQDDPRPQIYTARQLEEAGTASDLWNAAQRSYVVDGYMHNYMRMLWGKAVLQWTNTWSYALKVLEDLNNRFSLDGRDPNTYGGIHWIFGKFDRPFYRRPVYGTVRYMSLKAAEKKFDVDEYIRKISVKGEG
jgi:photolyase PhrII